MSNKDAGLRIRIDRNLRQRFLDICRAQDKPAAQVIREFMRDYIDSHEVANDAPTKNGESRKQGTKKESIA